MKASPQAPSPARTLAHEAARLRAMLSAAPAAIIELAPDGTVRSWNAGAERLYGWRADEVLGTTLPSVTDDELVFVRKMVADTMSGGSLHQVDARRQHKDGGMLDVCISTAPIDGADGEPDGIVAIVMDVTDHRWAASALKASERQYRAVTDGAPLGIAVMSSEERFLFVNRKYEDWFGIPRDQIIGLTARELLGEELHERAAPFVRRALRGETVTFDADVKLAGGQVRHLHVTYFPEVGEEGTTTGYFAVCEDATARKQLEDQFRQSQKMEAVGQLAGGIAHDFNNLLTVILSHADFLSEAAAQAGLADDAKQMRDAAHKAAALTRQLLAVSKKQSMQLKDLDLGHVVSGMEQLLSRTMGDNVALRVQLPESTGPVHADQGQVEQVIMNLVLNARDAMPDGGCISIAIDRVTVSAADAPVGVTPGAFVRLTVRDTGAGIAPEHKSRIFEPFFTTKELGMGTGLGLATVYGIVKQSEGHLTVESEPGQGSAFHVWLPEVPVDVRPIVRAVPKSATIGGRETVLLVEDEPIVRVIAQKSLERAGYTVLQAEHGEEALRLARGFAGPIHLLLTDLIMPQMGGVLLAQEFAKVRALTRVLFCTGYAGSELVKEGRLPANCGLIEKPFSPDSLAARVREVLDSPVASPAVHRPRQTRSA